MLNKVWGDVVVNCGGIRPIAQVVEHWSPKPKVVGSSPAGPVLSELILHLKKFRLEQIGEWVL